MDMMIWRQLLVPFIWLALSWMTLKVGTAKLARIAMMVMTTRSSIRVKPWLILVFMVWIAFGLWVMMGRSRARTVEFSLRVLDRVAANLTRKKSGLDIFDGGRIGVRMKLSTWNVNGVRAALNKGLREYLLGTDAAVVCLQETKAEGEQVDLSFLEGWRAVWNAAEKKGYSGTCVLSREPLMGHWLGMGLAEHDREGRVITVELADFYVVNVYTPNAQADLKRLSYRLEWDEAFRAYVKGLEAIKPVLICGDLNCAHEEIDLANPKANRNNPGFSDAERASFSAHLAAGWVDVLREFDLSPGRYTWWTMRTGGSAREKNIGWRLDYWLASAALRPRLGGCQIRADVYGSDHCPVEMWL